MALLAGTLVGRLWCLYLGVAGIVLLNSSMDDDNWGFWSSPEELWKRNIIHHHTKTDSVGVDFEGIPPHPTALWPMRHQSAQIWFGDGCHERCIGTTRSFATGGRGKMAVTRAEWKMTGGGNQPWQLGKHQFRIWGNPLVHNLCDFPSPRLIRRGSLIFFSGVGPTLCPQSAHIHAAPGFLQFGRPRCRNIVISGIQTGYTQGRKRFGQTFGTIFAWLLALGLGPI